MIDFKKYEHLYFLGIGGIGMSALARYFASQGFTVSGYDRNVSLITDHLIVESIDVNFEDSVDAIPESVKENNTSTLIVYTPAIPNDNNQLVFFRDHRFSVYKRAEILGEVTKNQNTVAVAGSHGKTSTSWLLAHVLKQSGINTFALLGGISVNYNTNYLSGFDPKASIFVVEADEYDRSFLKLFPDVGIITSVEPDHLDVYGDFDHLKASFNHFKENIKEDGYIFSFENCDLTISSRASRHLIYGFGENVDIRAENIKIENDSYVFDVVSKYFKLNDLKLRVAGKHNVLNALPVVAFSKMIAGVEDNLIKTSLDSYKGVKRRMEFVVRTPEKIFVDDYAHHPTEINATLSTLRELFPDKRITCVFQPHLYSRTNDFAEDFGKVLSNVDRLALLNIYPAREMPLPGVDSEMILKHVALKDKTLLQNWEVLDYINEDKNEILLLMGAGDIDQFIEPVKKQILIK